MGYTRLLDHTADVGVVAAVGAGAAAVSDWSHVDIVLPNGKLVGAIPAGVKERDNNLKQYIRFKVDAPNEIENLIISQIGKKYDWNGVLGLWIKRNWQDTDNWFCSELVAWAFKEAGKPLLRTEHLERITPRDLLLSPYLEQI